MRCIHCGKEIKDNVIFCIHCDRPAKREYSHYACEFYDGISILEKISNIFNGFSDPSSKKYNHTTPEGKKHNHTGAAQSDQKKGKSLKEIYGSYVKQEVSAEKAVSSNTGQRASGAEHPDNEDLSPLWNNIVDFFKKAFTVQKGKVGWSLLVLIIFLVSIIGNFINSFDNSDMVTYEDAAVSVNDYIPMYTFSDNPTIKDSLVTSIDSSPIGGRGLIIQYLIMLEMDVEELYYFNEPFYTLEEYQPYIDMIKQLEKEYVADSGYWAYNELFHIYALWCETIKPIYENPENYSEKEIMSKLDLFAWDLNDICTYYFSE